MSLAAALAIGATAAYAQAERSDGPSAPQEAQGPEIVVQAPRTVDRQVPEEPQAKQARMTLTTSVLYGDLDLAKEADAVRLVSRIRYAARDVCRDLDRLYPLDPDPECAERAFARASPQVQAAIDAARQRPAAVF